MNILKEGEHNIVDLSLSTFREIGDVCMTDKFVYIDSDDINSYNERYTTNFSCRIDFSFGIMFCYKGVYDVEINSRICHVQQGCACVVSKGTILKFDSSQSAPNVKYFCILLQKEDAGLALNDTRMLMILKDFIGKISDQVFQLKEKTTETMGSIFKTMSNSLKRSLFPYKNEVLQNCLSIMFYITIADVMERKENAIKAMPTRKEEIFSRFIDMVEKHYKEERQINYYASEMCVTPKYLSTVVHEVSGRYAREYISDFVMNEAKRLLYNSVCSVKEICVELHFDNPSFFGKYFKQHTGMTPLDFRKASN